MFEKRTGLLRRGPIEQIPPRKLQSTLLVAEKPVASWEEHEEPYGYDLCSLRMALSEEGPCFLLRRTWIAGWGYSCPQIAEEEVLSLEEGTKLAEENGQQLPQQNWGEILPR